MRGPSPRMLANTTTVTVYPAGTVWVRDAAGGKSPPSGAGASYPASVQPMQSHMMSAFHLDVAKTYFTAYFRVDPNVHQHDTILWNGQTLRVIAPARDEGGRGACFAVDAELVT